MLQVIRCLADAGGCVNRPDRHGLAPLHFALHAEQAMGAAAYKLLMELGAEHTSEFNVLDVAPPHKEQAPPHAR